MEQNRNAKPVKGMKGRVPGGQKPSVENPGKVLKRLMDYVMRHYRIHVIVVVLSILTSVVCNAQGMIFRDWQGQSEELPVSMRSVSLPHGYITG